MYSHGIYISGFFHELLFIDRISGTSAGGIDPDSLYSFKIRESSSGLGSFPHSRDGVVFDFAVFIQKTVQSQGGTVAGSIVVYNKKDSFIN